MPTLRLLDDGYAVTLWFMNPNIQPLSEYFRRREAAIECAARLGVEIIFEDAAWDLRGWLKRQMAHSQDEKRCEWCCQSRLDAACGKALQDRYDFFSTTLLYSRYQPHEAIARRGKELEGGSGARFYYRDFRTDWQAGIDKAIAWGVYRQPYCGCVFSEAERYGKKLRRLIDANDTKA